ncbi:AAA family ATPase [Chryseobacterium gallinarum]|uniref:AAA family ATPase n=1 Tax=Chryseobacterium gallinarum TaxID=1324352 RepID=A0ABX6KNS9_CHRGL|nr:AAA family ATPase [Chryseobacterium gallinarum]QIY90245.1 AAA family ATPase [Chryseobacterium gallinarum]
MLELYIMTGGPGAGKTTLLTELEKKGFIAVPEEGRRIIKEQMSVDGNALPWMNKEKFATLMFEASVDTYKKMSEMPDGKTIFFDRGILDTIGYMRLEKIPVPEVMELKARGMAYHNDVFILPPWKEIYENDPERKQTFEVAMSTFECMLAIYQEYGYNTIEVPRLKLEQRARFILDIIKTRC